jgi:hypothetical protein
LLLFKHQFCRLIRTGIDRHPSQFLRASAALGLIFLAVAVPVSAAPREKDRMQYGAGLIVNIPFPENEVTPVVQDVVQNGIIRGTKEYNKDEYITGAVAAASTRVFSDPPGPGKVFYKLRLQALDPRNFKDSGDMGTLAVRYIVQPQGDKNTVLRIDARFVEEFRRTSHESNGSVESAEYKDIHDRLDNIASMKEQTAEAEQEKLAQGSSSSSRHQLQSDPAPPPPAPEDPPPASTTLMRASDLPSNNRPPDVPTLEERVKDLRLQVERLVKSPGAPLKSAPFHTASTLLSLPTGSEVLIVISTPYWFGVETHDGQHGWMQRDALEPLP